MYKESLYWMLMIDDSIMVLFENLHQAYRYCKDMKVDNTKELLLVSLVNVSNDFYNKENNNELIFNIHEIEFGYKRIKDIKVGVDVLPYIIEDSLRLNPLKSSDGYHKLLNLYDTRKDEADIIGNKEYIDLYIDEVVYGFERVIKEYMYEDIFNRYKDMHSDIELLEEAIKHILYDGYKDKLKSIADFYYISLLDIYKVIEDFILCNNDENNIDIDIYEIINFDEYPF